MKRPPWNLDADNVAALVRITGVRGHHCAAFRQRLDFFFFFFFSFFFFFFFFFVFFFFFFFFFFYFCFFFFFFFFGRVAGMVLERPIARSCASFEKRK